MIEEFQRTFDEKIKQLERLKSEGQTEILELDENGKEVPFSIDDLLKNYYTAKETVDDFFE